MCVTRPANAKAPSRPEEALSFSWGKRLKVEPIQHKLDAHDLLSFIVRYCSAHGTDSVKISHYTFPSCKFNRVGYSFHTSSFPSCNSALSRNPHRLCRIQSHRGPVSVLPELTRSQIHLIIILVSRSSASKPSLDPLPWRNLVERSR